MDEVTITLLWGLAVFILVFLVNYYVVFKGVLSKLFKSKKKEKVSKKKKPKRVDEFIGFSYLVPKFKLDVTKIDLNYAAVIIAITNAFIISLVFIVISLIPWGLMFKMLLGFVLLFALIYALYELIGRSFVKKGWR